MNITIEQIKSIEVGDFILYTHMKEGSSTIIRVNNLPYKYIIAPNKYLYRGTIITSSNNKGIGQQRNVVLDLDEALKWNVEIIKDKDEYRNK